MPGFLYFVQNLSQPPRLADLRPLGLEYALAKLPGYAGVNNFQGGLNGGILFDPERVDPGRAAYRPGTQKWIQAPGSRVEKVFVGVDQDDLPGPGDLQRERMLPGTAIELGDQQRWIIPVARSWDDGGWSNELPASVSIDAEGKWIRGEIVPRYQELWQVASDYVSLQCGGATPEEEARLNSYGLFSAATLALQANYLVGPAECSLLRLWDQHNARQALWELVQMEALEELSQKKMTQPGAGEASISPSSAGPAVSTEVSAPPT